MATAGWDQLFAMGMELDTFPNPASTAYVYGLPSTDTLRIDDLLDFSSSSTAAVNANTHLTANPTVNIHHSHFGSSSSSSFPDDLYTIHSEEAAELEWLSQFVEDSFSYDVIPNPTAPAAAADLRPAEPTSATGRGARSKRSRPHAINAAWSSSVSGTSSSSSSSEVVQRSPKPNASSNGRRRSGGGGARGEAEKGGGPRRCTHCQSEKTPQWRLGPDGPKTLCNACGVRYKSGRLVPEYRPAASPTFVLSQHSNSHRKVIELRRQNEMLHDGARNSSSSHFLDYEVC